MMKRWQEGPLEESDPGCSAEEHGGGSRSGLSDRFSDRSFARASGMLRALGDEPRLRLLESLSRSEACVTELAAHSGEGMSTVSQRLRLLRSEGLVTGRREGKHVYYSLADGHVEELLRSVLTHAEEDVDTTR